MSILIGQGQKWSFRKQGVIQSSVLIYYELQKQKSFPFECLLSSKYVKQSNNFQITMTEQRQFKVKQIVWGKVSDYPWWPARIVKTLAQRNRNIYRVHFFGDPTYCFLQPSQLLDFESGLASFQEGNSGIQILKKPIQLARAAYKKSKQQQNYMDIQTHSLPEIQPNNSDFFEQSKIQQKFAMENMEKQLADKINETNILSQKTEFMDYTNSLNTQNIVQQITGYQYNELKSSKGYNKRKQLLNCEMRMKELLLSKYNLLHLSKFKSVQVPKQKNIKILKRKLVQKKKQKKSREDITVESGRKLLKILRKNLGDVIENTCNIFTLTMEWLNKNTKKYNSRYIRIIRLIKQTSEQINIQKGNSSYTKKDFQQLILTKMYKVDEIQEHNQASCERMDGNSNCSYIYSNDEQKKYDEQKSKVTQIDAHSL